MAKGPKTEDLILLELQAIRALQADIAVDLHLLVVHMIGALAQQPAE